MKDVETTVPAGGATPDRVDRRFPGVIVLALIFMVLASALILSGWHPIHDSVNWFPFFDYFQSSIASGTIPLWNPYSQLGMPFFQNFQTLALLEPSTLLTAALYLFDDLGTLDLQIIRLFTRFFVFAAGTYWTLKLITGDARASLIFSIVMVVGLLPSFLRQSGLVDNNMFVPLLSALTILYFRQQSVRTKGLALVTLCCVVGISLNNHIPSVPLFHFAILFVLYAQFVGGGIVPTLRAVIARPLIPWTAAGVILIGILSLPVIALNLELRTAPELFGSLRLFNSNQGGMIPFFASDLSDASVFFPGQMTRVFLSLQNVLGFITEPFLAVHATTSNPSPPGWHVWGNTSEIRLYLGLLPLAFGVVALWRRSDAAAWIFGVLAAVMLVISVGLDLTVEFRPGPTSPIQSFLFALLPWLEPIEALQNTGCVFVFDAVVLATIGWARSTARTKRMILVGGFVVVVTKALSLSLWQATQPYTVTNLDFWWLMAALALVAAAFTVAARRGAWRAGLALVAIADVAIFASALAHHNMGSNLSPVLARAGVAEIARPHALPRYRAAFPTDRFLWQPREAHGITAPELVTRRFFGIGPPALRYLDVRGQRFSQFFRTRSNYDFVANVPIEYQLAASGVVNPVLTYFPEDGAIYVDGAPDAVARMKATPVGDLNRLLILESGEGQKRPKVEGADIASFFREGSQPRATPEQVRDLLIRSRLQAPLPPGVEITVLRWGANGLDLRYRVPEPGWLYWSDGYSRHWRATVNGVAADIAKANVNFKAVRVPPGEGRVEFTYNPVFFCWSVHLYFAGIAIFALLVCVATAREFARRTGSPTPGRAGSPEAPTA